MTNKIILAPYGRRSLKGDKGDVGAAGVAGTGYKKITDIYCDVTGGSDTNPGTLADPVLTIDQALTLAEDVGGLASISVNGDAICSAAHFFIDGAKIWLRGCTTDFSANQSRELRFQNGAKLYTYLYSEFHLNNLSPVLDLADGSAVCYPQRNHELVFSFGDCVVTRVSGALCSAVWLSLYSNTTTWGPNTPGYINLTVPAGANPNDAAYPMHRSNLATW